jgi:outer membrane PBP1 activator LpoA protein
MIAAHDADRPESRPELRFEDTQSANAVESYRKLVAEGAGFVVGPLLKEEISSLAQSGELPVPILALNQSPDVNHEKIVQYGLTPEQEIEQAAGSAWFDGKQNALLLAPASSLGQRLIQHFSNYWKSLGGKVLAMETYSPGGNDFSNPVERLVARAEAAAKDGPQADFVILIADSRDASLLKPYLQTHKTYVDLPVYATSLVYNGHPEAPQNLDLNGIIFCDLPWLLDTETGQPLSRAALASQLEQMPDTSLQRLLAMGLDAYRLAPRLEELKQSSQNRFDGATGVLTLGPDLRVRRQLKCAQFEGNTLQMRGIAPLLQAGAPR